MAYTYYVPSVQIQQEFTQIPTFTSTPLAALIIGLVNPATSDTDVNGVSLVSGGSVNSASTLNGLLNTISSISDITTIPSILGTPSVSNPVALGVYNALLNSNGSPVYFCPLTGEGTATAGTASTNTLTGSSSTNVSDGDTVTIGTTVYRFKNTLAQVNDVKIAGSGNSDASFTNLIDAINGTGTAGTNWYAGTVANTVASAGTLTSHAFTITAIATGSTLIAVDASSSEATWGAGTAGTDGTNTTTYWNTALMLAQKSNSYYGVVPVFSSSATLVLRSVIDAALIAHVETMSTQYKAKWRTAWFSTPINGNDLSTNIGLDAYVASLPIASGAVSPVSSANNARFHNVFPGTYYIGNQAYDGCFAAAALAGLRSGSVPHQSLTNAQVNLGGAAKLPDVVLNYSEDVLNQLAEAGCWILTQDGLGGTVYVRQQLTAEGANQYSNLNYMEDSITANVDSISYGLQAALAPYVGIYNVSPAALLKIRAAVDNELSFRTSNTFTETAGNQLIGYDILSIAQDATFKDKVNINITLEVPYPMNYINVTLSI